ncbi:hypothetical protein NEAUS06_1486 [Nematocida ausubeli]|nr:hypothetical protein NEAUS06_1486 [Nematocida ausubeli]
MKVQCIVLVGIAATSVICMGEMQFCGLLSEVNALQNTLCRVYRNQMIARQPWLMGKNIPPLQSLQQNVLRQAYTYPMRTGIGLKAGIKLGGYTPNAMISGSLCGDKTLLLCIPSQHEDNHHDITSQTGPAEVHEVHEIAPATNDIPKAKDDGHQDRSNLVITIGSTDKNGNSANDVISRIVIRNTGNGAEATLDQKNSKNMENAGPKDNQNSPFSPSYVPSVPLINAPTASDPNLKDNSRDYPRDYPKDKDRNYPNDYPRNNDYPRDREYPNDLERVQTEKYSHKSSIKSTAKGTYTQKDSSEPSEYSKYKTEDRIKSSKETREKIRENVKRTSESKYSRDKRRDDQSDYQNDSQKYKNSSSWDRDLRDDDQNDSHMKKYKDKPTKDYNPDGDDYQDWSVTSKEKKSFKRELKLQKKIIRKEIEEQYKEKQKKIEKELKKLKSQKKEDEKLLKKLKNSEKSKYPKSSDDSSWNEDTPCGKNKCGGDSTPKRYLSEYDMPVNHNSTNNKETLARIERALRDLERKTAPPQISPSYIEEDPDIGPDPRIVYSNAPEPMNYIERKHYIFHDPAPIPKKAKPVVYIRASSIL